MHRPCRTPAPGYCLPELAKSAISWPILARASKFDPKRLAGRIQVTPSTRELLRDSCSFEERGPVDVKGLGRMTTYLIGLA
jgi:hypothetical protein